MEVIFELRPNIWRSQLFEELVEKYFKLREQQEQRTTQGGKLSYFGENIMIKEQSDTRGCQKDIQGRDHVELWSRV